MGYYLKARMKSRRNCKTEKSEICFCIGTYRSVFLTDVHHLYLWLRINVIEIPIRRIPVHITYHNVHRVTESLVCAFGTNKIRSTQDMFILTALYNFIPDNNVVGIK